MVKADSYIDTSKALPVEQVMALMNASDFFSGPGFFPVTEVTILRTIFVFCFLGVFGFFGVWSFV